MRTRTRFGGLMVTTCAGLVALQGGDCQPGMNNMMNDPFQRVTLNVVKINTQSTTERGPAVGDGIIAFNAQSGAILAYLKVGETQPTEVPIPTGLDNDSDHFAFSGKKLVGKDRTSGRMWVYDSVTDQSAATALQSINLGTNESLNAWDVSGDWIATINATVTSQDGANRRIKVVNIADVTNLVVTPFTTDPDQEPNAVSVDATTKKVAVRGGDSFYIYNIDSPGDSPMKWTLSALQGGFGSTTAIELRGESIAFFDDSDKFSILNITTGTRTQPGRNPARSEEGLAFENDRFAYFAAQTQSDGSTISNLNRCLVGKTDDLTNLLDPEEIFVNGSDASEGVVGFGSTTAITPDGKYTFVAGATPVGVGIFERLYLSTDGATFKAVADATDSLNVLRAAGVGVSGNLVAFLIPADADGFTVNVGYAELPPP